MEKEVEYFEIGGGLGGNQDWFCDRWMYLGGCAAVTACDVSIYLKKYKGVKELYPNDENALSKEDYIAFSKVMKPYLRPRFTGIDKLEIYIDGYGKYIKDRGCDEIQLLGLSGEESLETAKRAMIEQIDGGYPIPNLTLRHKNAQMQDYVWHWYLIIGYRIEDGKMSVKVVTYGKSQWLDFETLWNTGFRKKGGLILLREKELSS